MMTSYATATTDEIRATLATLRHFRAFLASSCREMRDPYEVEEWRDGATRLDKAAAQRKLSWLVHMAVSRKGGACLPINDSATGASLNHRGRACRKEGADYQRHQRQDAHDLNRPRLRIYSLRTPELMRRFRHRLVQLED